MYNTKYIKNKNLKGEKYIQRQILVSLSCIPKYYLTEWPGVCEQMPWLLSASVTGLLSGAWWLKKWGRIIREPLILRMYSQEILSERCFSGHGCKF